MKTLVFIESIVGAFILLAGVYYVLRKMISAMMRKEYLSVVDKFIDRVILQLLEIISKKKKDELSKSSRTIIIVLRTIILGMAYYQVIKVINFIITIRA